MAEDVTLWIREAFYMHIWYAICITRPFVRSCLGPFLWCTGPHWCFAWIWILNFSQWLWNDPTRLDGGFVVIIRRWEFLSCLFVYDKLEVFALSLFVVVWFTWWKFCVISNIKYLISLFKTLVLLFKNRKFRKKKKIWPFGAIVHYVVSGIPFPFAYSCYFISN